MKTRSDELDVPMAIEECIPSHGTGIPHSVTDASLCGLAPGTSCVDTSRTLLKIEECISIRAIMSNFQNYDNCTVIDHCASVSRGDLEWRWLVRFQLQSARSIPIMIYIGGGTFDLHTPFVACAGQVYDEDSEKYRVVPYSELDCSLFKIAV